jgi:hypothetical protein
MGRYCMPNEDDLGGIDAIEAGNMKIAYDSVVSLFKKQNLR